MESILLFDAFRVPHPHLSFFFLLLMHKKETAMNNLVFKISFMTQKFKSLGRYNFFMQN
jgi:hypothetical protein